MSSILMSSGEGGSLGVGLLLKIKFNHKIKTSISTPYQRLQIAGCCFSCGFAGKEGQEPPVESDYLLSSREGCLVQGRSCTSRQGCISCGILVSGIRARGVSSEHMENMEIFSCSPT